MGPALTLLGKPKKQQLKPMKPKFLKSRRRGFALIVTLSLMILLTVIAVGLLSLSSISLRATGQGSDLAVARANARMALMFAIGDLQKYAGQDTRVTAKADLLDEANPAVLGVWKSWEGKDHDPSGTTAGRPVKPTYANHKKANFQAWLASAKDNTDMDSVPDAAASGADKVTLLGENTVGDKEPAKRQIHLTPTQIKQNKSRGSYAWWIGGENQKARLPRPYAPATGNAATWSILAKTHAVADTAPFGFDDLLKDPSLKDPAKASPADKAISLKQSDLLDPTGGSSRKVSQDFFHDLSTTSVGLLTNTATGGWRKDLSLVAENWTSSTFPSSGLPFFRNSPGTDLLFTRPESNPNNPRSILYPWSGYRSTASGNGPIYSFPAIGSWANLVSYATLYKSGTLGTATATSAMTAGYSATKIDGDIYSFIHKVRILPLIARIQWIYSHKAERSLDAPTKYDLKLLVTPVVTLWNPYNVTLAASGGLHFQLSGSLPPVITYKVGGTALAKKVTLQSTAIAGVTATEARGVTGETTYNIPAVASLAPGETRVFSPKGPLAEGDTYDLVPGYVPNGGKSYFVVDAVTDPVTNKATRPSFSAGAINVDAKFESEYQDPPPPGIGPPGVGMFLNMNWDAVQGTVLAYRMLFDKSTAHTAYPAITLPSSSITEAAASPVPFLSVTFGARMASNTHLPSKGFVQSSPFVNYTAMGKKGDYEATIGAPSYPGVLNNVNSPFEFSFQALTSVNEYTPQSDPVTKRGYILTGFKASNGLQRCVIDELPGRPLSSLAELQNWDARYENPIPPYSFNLVGNSDATPLIPSDAVINTNSRGDKNLQHDDSYCLNHILFDDWFFSSIASEPAAFGRPTTTNYKTVYSNFLLGDKDPLANRSYKPLPADRRAVLASPGNVNALVTKNIGSIQTSWKTIASRLEVEGMFNVNSTSVTAWRALLGHARNQEIPYIGSNGKPTTSSESDYAFSRFSVAGDTQAGTAGGSGLSNGSEFAGYRVFDKGQLDFLADEIVKQVRLRGPFLSLSEFVNRQLSSGNLALAGAVQTALNNLDSSKRLFTALQADTTPAKLGTNKASDNPGGGPSGYVYKDAAVGYSLYGLPGWTRQADVLRPLAPILSVRDDTFTIRGYGDSRDPTGKIKASAVCEATVRRSRDYMDIPAGKDTTEIDTQANSATVPTKSTLNSLFGRRFELVSFRWLSPNEI